MVSIDGSLFIQIVNFLFLIWVLNMVLYKPIRKALTQRKEKVDGLESGIEAMAREVEEQNQSYNQGIKEARSKGKEEKEALLEATAQEERAIVDKINAKAQEDLAVMRTKIAEEAQQAKAALMQEIDVFANAIGEKILGRAI